ncbi:PREDICTED: MATH domain and coiled-coil domain-containing protein At3g27040-like [Camelina sativa]|uniref:MATH domain and coiled-coil domain-containing protein At3g27040-like n=1 Tax=Camelina sativa TaxID=90675 RepID=A0ABM1RS33_CAMSA|nr:PREDICTED: MATH domain and coiled-coil domain-containing protein At3g27040-like [Camelina sativa]
MEVLYNNQEMYLRVTVLLKDKGVYSDTFVAGRCKWRLLAYPLAYDFGYYFSLSVLCIPNSESLPSGWRRDAKFSFTLVNQVTGERFHQKEREYWFDQTHTSLDNYKFYLPESMIFDEVKIVAEVDVLEVIGEVDVPEETKGSIDINGFQVPASQVEYVKSLFKKHPGFVSRLCPKNPHLRKAYLNVILSLTTETLSKSPDELSNGDLADAYSALRFVTNAGFKLDWLEKKLKKTGETRLQEIEQELEDLKVKRADILQW